MNFAVINEREVKFMMYRYPSPKAEVLAGLCVSNPTMT